MKKPVETLDKLIADLKATQLWLLEHGRPKNNNVRLKIAFASSIREWLLKGVNRTHMGRLSIGADNTCRLIEHSGDRDITRFVNGIKDIVNRDTYHDFTTSRFRLLYLTTFIGN